MRPALPIQITGEVGLRTFLGLSVWYQMQTRPGHWEWGSLASALKNAVLAHGV